MSLENFEKLVFYSPSVKFIDDILGFSSASSIRVRPSDDRTGEKEN
jgi:hypothetical protein